MRIGLRPPAFWGLAALLILELVAAAAAAVVLVIDLLVLEAASLPSAIALTVLAVIAVAWMAATVVGLFRGQGWVRASAIVWQVLQFAIGAGALQGETAQPAWGWPILLVAVAAFVLLFRPSLVGETQKRGESA